MKFIFVCLRQFVDVCQVLPSCVFSCLNIRSLGRKIDDVIELQRDHAIDVFALVEMWHDLVAICHLGLTGHSVVDRVRPHLSNDTLAVNHGGIAVFARPGVRLAAISLGFCPASFEMTATRATVGFKSYVIIVIYRPGFVDVTSMFFYDLSDLLDRVVTTNDTLFIVGDLNIHLEWSDDVHAQCLCNLLGCYNLDVRNTEPTHDLGGQLDTVVS